MTRAILFPVLLYSAFIFPQLEFVGAIDGFAEPIYLADDEIAYYIRTDNNAFELYNSDLTLLSAVTVPFEYDFDSPYNILFVSRELFDCDDSNIEYLISAGGLGSDEHFVRVIREDGTVIFDLPDYWYRFTVRWYHFPPGPAGLIEDENGVTFTFSSRNSENEVRIYRS